MQKWWTFLFVLGQFLSHAQERCYTPIRQQIAQEAIPEFLELQATLASIVENHTGANLRNGPLTIPVVFHLVGQAGSYFPVDQLVYSQLDVLNEDYGLSTTNISETPFDARPLAIDMGLRFCLAFQDPDGSPTTGIIRTVTPQECIGDVGRIKAVDGRPRLYYTALGGSDAWDSNRFLNIWVAETCEAFLGFASFPGEGIPEEDGVVIDPQVFGRQDVNPIGTPYDQGRTTTHEVGHFFNLQHIWGNGCDSDDEVADTPNQERSHLGCPIYPSISCGSPDYFFNFMDYSDDACLTMFTKGQRDRVWASIQTLRPGFLRDLGCQEEPTLTSNFLVYPNPARDIVYFKFPLTELGPIDIVVFDARGRKIEQVNFDNDGARWIDVAQWVPGVYFFESVLGYLGSFVVTH